MYIVIQCNVTTFPNLCLFAPNNSMSCLASLLLPVPRKPTSSTVSWQPTFAWETSVQPKRRPLGLDKIQREKQLEASYWCLLYVFLMATLERFLCEQQGAIHKLPDTSRRHLSSEKKWCGCRCILVSGSWLQSSLHLLHTDRVQADVGASQPPTSSANENFFC